MNLFRSFPEYSEAESVLEDTIKTALKSARYFEDAHGAKFKEFVTRQETCHVGLIGRINDAMVGEKKLFDVSAKALEKVKQEMVKVKTLNEGIKAQRKDAEKLAEKAEKSQREVIIAQKKLEAEKAKAPTSAAIPGLEDKYRYAIRIQEADAQLRDSKNLQLAEEEIKYKEAIFEAILNALRVMIKPRMESDGALISIGAEVVNIAGQIPDFEDLSFAALQTELQTLDTDLNEMGNIKANLQAGTF